MDTGPSTQNWFGDIHGSPAVIVRPRSVDDIIAVVKDRGRYPSPVRAAGSNHSTTPCVVADGGTVLDMRGMTRISHIGDDTVTAEAGALYIDVAKTLERHGRQFYVNIELGNLSMGSAACTHTKDASFPGEFGIVSSYAIGMKVVRPNGDVLEITDAQPDLLRAMRTSFGLLGVVYEVTFRIKPLRAMSVYHEVVRISEIADRLPSFIARGESMMYYLFPFQDRMVIEFRRYGDGPPGNHSLWKLRNLGWKTVAPAVTGLVRRAVPGAAVRHVLLEAFGRPARMLMPLMRAPNTSPPDQMIRYPERGGASRYTFSIWAFPEAEFPRVVNEYVALCREYHRTGGYRCDLPNVGYRIHQDSNSLFSYTHDGTAMTVDPVSTGGDEWPAFLDVYNEFCSRNGGWPLFNQSARLTPAQVTKAFGSRLETFRDLQRRIDPDRRFVNRYFADLLGLPEPARGTPAAT
jgi:FAD/FMN-containing dehydrogenase